MTTVELIEMKYPNGFSIFDVLTNKLLSSLVPENYLPKFIFMGEIGESDAFMEQNGRFWDARGELFETFFVYVRPNGSIAYDSNQSLLQVDRKLRGFLARISAPKSARVAQQMELDYFIDLNSVEYEIQSSRISDKKEGVILSSDMIHFGVLEPSRYFPKVHFDEMLTDFIAKREDFAKFLGL